MKKLFNRIIEKINQNVLIKRMLKVLIYGIGGAVFAKGITLLINILIARIINEQEYGIYSLINNTVQTFTLFAGAGIGVTLTRDIALYRNKDKKLAGILIKTLAVFNIVLSAIIALLVFIFSEQISGVLSDEVNIAFYLRITAFSVFFTSVSLVWQSVLQGFEKFKNIAVIQVINNIVILILSIILTKLFSITGAIVSLLLLQVFNFIAMYMISKKHINKADITLKLEFNNVVKESIFKHAIPAFLSGVFVLPVLWFTNITYTQAHGYESFALFSVCLQWLTIINYIPQQLGQAKPIYTQLYAEKKYNDFKKIITRMIGISIIFSVLAVLVLSLGNRIILNAYGQTYTNAKIPFIIMIVTSVFMTVQSQFGVIYQAIGKFWTCFALNALWGVLFIALFFALLQFGIIGYALTYLISYIVYASISYIVYIYIIKKGEENEFS